MKASTIITAITMSLSPVVMVQADDHKQSAMTAEEQKAATPDQVLADLLAGNKRYVAGEITDLNIQANIKATSKGQYPSAVILSCLDSRVPVENVFDQGIGDVFVGRVAGNVENVDMLGSFEFATKLAGSKLIMVLGHEACGAVKGACDGAKMGNLTDLLAKIQPAVDAVKGDYKEEEQNSKNLDFVNKVVEENVRMTVADIREDSPVLAEMEKAGDIKIVGAIYSLHTGEVTLLD
ncbi:MAG: carbonic anhydrase family protein [Akkermansiaceae bacterium]